MSTWPPSGDDLRLLLREHALVIGPGETLVVMLSDSFTPMQCREIYDALNAVSYELGFRVMVTPATAVTVAPLADVEGVTAGMSDATRYGTLAFSLNMLLDEGATLDIAETLAHLQEGTLFAWLGETFRGGTGLSLMEQADLDAMLARFRELHGAVSAGRVYGIEHNGLALLLAWCLSALHELQSQPGPAPLRRSG